MAWGTISAGGFRCFSVVDNLSYSTPYCTTEYCTRALVISPFDEDILPSYKYLFFNTVFELKDL